MNKISEGVSEVYLLESYTGSDIDHFQPYIILTNIQYYVELFAKIYQKPICSGSAMTACHCEEERISIVYFGIGSPVAALIVELLANVKPYAMLMLGTCHGLREEYKIGDYFSPVAAIRSEGTSDVYMPEWCPSLSSFVIQRHVAKILEQEGVCYYSGGLLTTNALLWKNKPEILHKTEVGRSQGLDHECATLFTTGFFYNIAIGALLLITGLPLQEIDVKVANAGRKVLEDKAKNHLSLGIKVFKSMQQIESKGFGYQF